MAVKKPIVNYDGQLSQIEDDDTIDYGVLSGVPTLNTSMVKSCTVSTTASTAAKIGVMDTDPVAGDFIFVTYTLGTTASSATLNINGTGAKNVRIANANASSISHTTAAGGQLLYFYDGTYFHLLGSQRNSDADTTTYSTYTGSTQVDSIGLTRNKIVMENPDGTYTGLSIGNVTTDTKVQTSTPLNMYGRVMYYNSTAAIAPNGTSTSWIVSGITPVLTYTFNSAGSYTLRAPLYLVGTVNSDGYLILDQTNATSWYSQTLPTTDDGKVYFRLGIVYSATQIALDTAHVPLWYKSGSIRQYPETGAESGGIHYYSDTAPVSPGLQDSWTDTTSGITYYRYQNFWVELGPSFNVSPTVTPTPTPSSGPTGETAFDPLLVNINAGLTENNSRLILTGAEDSVSGAYTDTAITAPTYFEMRLHRGGGYALGAGLGGNANSPPPDNVHIGRAWNEPAVVLQSANSGVLHLYGNTNLPGDTSTHFANVSKSVPYDEIVQFAVNPTTRAVWIRSETEPSWFGGGDPTLGTSPSIVLAGTGTIRPYANTSSASNWVEMMSPADFAGAVPSGFSNGVIPAPISPTPTPSITPSEMTPTPTPTPTPTQGGGTPVIVGYDNPSIGNTDLPGGDGRVFMTRIQITNPGTLNHIAIYSLSTGGGLIKGVMYADSFGSPGALVAVGSPVAVVANNYVNSICNSESLSPGFYWIGAITQDFTSGMCTASNGGTGWAQWGDAGYANPPNPWTGGSSTEYRVLAYIEYMV